jgi:hypothetical protein
MRVLPISTLTATVVVLGITAPALASPAMIAKAKEAGYPVQNCQYCHTTKLPKKDTFKPEELNERGKYLVAEKDTKKAKAVDVQWLKDYPGGKEQK